MAVGDVISGIFTTTGVYHDFQPAGSNEIVITAVLGSNANTLYAGLYDGTTQSTGAVINGANWSNSSNTKIGITNTNYFRTYANAGTPPSYTGIQIK